MLGDLPDPPEEIESLRVRQEIESLRSRLAQALDPYNWRATWFTDTQGEIDITNGHPIELPHAQGQMLFRFDPIHKQRTARVIAQELIDDPGWIAALDLEDDDLTDPYVSMLKDVMDRRMQSKREGE